MNQRARLLGKGAVASEAGRDSILLRETFLACRAATEAICAPLELEDHVIQPAPFVSPPKWHLAHTSWFFECFLLEPLGLGADRLPQAGQLFNSYYKSQGEHWPQGQRGHLSRPTVAEVLNYRGDVTSDVVDALDAERMSPEQLEVLKLGIEHERQHQELLLMDIKFLFAGHPRPPAYVMSGSAQAALKDGDGDGNGNGDGNANGAGSAALDRALQWLPFEAGLRRFGAEASGFAFDNERPRHRRWLEDFELADRLVSNAEYLAFVNDGGYERPTLWLSDGWDWLQREAVRHPLYWRRDGAGGWLEYHLDGLAPLRAELPVAHLSHYEADAYARWAGARLPTEFELECLQVAQPAPSAAAFWAPGEPVLPLAGKASDAYGGGLLWEWTQSAYAAYPGYYPPSGGLGEYNGKFMSGQFVLRGGCVATPRGHWRASYRNFYRAHDRWAFNGLRLARDLGKQA